ncbi:MAG: L-histidine N(alpha)-methyltransferase [Isosphaeraceae bacterium]
MTTIKPLISRQGEAQRWRAQFLKDVVHGLNRPQKEIPCKYFYDKRGSQLFDEICELDEYYLTRTEVAILQGHARAMALAVGEDCELIEFGSGSGLKTRLLLEQLPRPRAYVPIDISREPLEQSARALAERFPGLRIHTVHADFTGDVHLPDVGDPKARRVVYFPGSTIGNFRPDAALGLLRSIAQLVGPGGGLLIGLDLDKEESIVWPAYNDRQGVTAAFNRNLLTRINTELGAEFDLDAFAHRADYLRDHERVEMHLVSVRAQVVRIAGTEFSFEEGETIRTECSYKYSLEHFNRLAIQAGFTPNSRWSDPDEYFSVSYLSVD